jgi:hypothetical protein
MTSPITPQFKLILLMNPPPKLDADKAMRRRLHSRALPH